MVTGGSCPGASESIWVGSNCKSLPTVARLVGQVRPKISRSLFSISVSETVSGWATGASGRALSNLGQPFAVIFKIGGSYKWSSPYPLVARPTEPNCKLDTAWGAVPRFNESSR